jgi:hydrogenase expression/formation protein HypE
MSAQKLPDLGKIHPEFFDRVIYPRLGAADDAILIGPRHGVDYGVIRIGDIVAALSTDPFFIVPSLGFARAAWFAFHIVFCDVAVSGLMPKYLAIDLNLPPEITEEELEELWGAVHDEARRYGISVVTGHTARYTGCAYPMVGGATAIALGDERHLRGPHRAKIGDEILITKGPAIETTGLLAALFPGKFIEAGGETFQKEAAAVFAQMSVLDDCAIARTFKGVHVMHDATECGIWGGLFEMARAGAYGLRIEQDAIPVQPVVRKTAEVFGFDPFASISEGTLIVAVDGRDADELVDAFAAEGIPAAVCGEIVPETEGVRVIRNGAATELAHPVADPYWKLAAELSR